MLQIGSHSLLPKNGYPALALAQTILGIFHAQRDSFLEIAQGII